jgi:hypothetical protein
MKNFFNRKNGFIFLMIASTFALATSAAYYSVFGLSSLFAGAKTEVIIMAGALEFSKLIIASYLHNHWNTIGWLKWYLTSAVVILMIITSLGIYGFLTSAYQTTADKLGTTNKLVEVVELKKGRFQEQLTYYNDDKLKLNESINNLRGGLVSNTQSRVDSRGNLITTTSSSQRNALESQLKSSVEQRELVSKKIEGLTDSITKLEFDVLDLQTNNEVMAEVGPLRYMSEITGKPMNIIVNWFTLLIVFVFDPLAISMVIALNKLINKEQNGNKLYSIINNGDSHNSGNGIFISNPNNEEVSYPKTSSRNPRQSNTNSIKSEDIKSEEQTKAKKEKVTFVVTDEDIAKELYNEKIESKKLSTPTHTYKITGADRYNRNK